MRKLIEFLFLAAFAMAPLTASALPDLRVQLLFATEENEDCKSQVHYIIQVINMGDSPAENGFDMNLVFHADEQPTPENVGTFEGLHIVVDEPLAAYDLHQEEAFWKSETGIAGGKYKSWLLVDPLDVVEESDETNNKGGPTHFEVNPVICDPGNLAVTAFNAVLEEGPSGLKVTYTAQISNVQGSAVPDSFRVDLYHHRDKIPGYNDPGDASMIVDGLGAGETITFLSAWENPEEGVYHSFVAIDGDGMVFEPTEADNIDGPLVVAVCKDCPECPDAEYAPAPCLCADLPHAEGSCCTGSWYPDGCPSPDVTEVSQPEAIPEAVEQDLDDVLQPPDNADDDAVSEDAIPEALPSEAALPDDATDVVPDATSPDTGTNGGGSSSGGCSAAPHAAGTNLVNPAALLLLALLASLLNRKRAAPGPARRSPSSTL